MMVGEKTDIFGHVGGLNPVPPCGHSCQKISGSHTKVKVTSQSWQPRERK